MKDRSFYFKFYPQLVMAEVMTMTNEQRGEWLNQLLVDLTRDDCGQAVLDFAKAMIGEAQAYRQKKAEAGSKGGKQRSSNAQAVLKQNPSDAQALSSNTQASNSNSIKINTKTKGVVFVCLDDFKKIFPTLRNIDAHAADASRWTFENPEKAPKSGASQFLSNWLKKSLDNQPISPLTEEQKFEAMYGKAIW